MWSCTVRLVYGALGLKCTKLRLGGARFTSHHEEARQVARELSAFVLKPIVRHFSLTADHAHALGLVRFVAQ
jgi:hypothetical protein